MVNNEVLKVLIGISGMVVLAITLAVFFELRSRLRR